MIYIKRYIPEAYAAWDTGTLLVEYMESHDGRWPSSWDDLWSVMNSNSDNQITLKGYGADNTNYLASLQRMVAIDWKFEPTRGGQRAPVTRPDRTRFRVVWEEPSAMIRGYLKTRASTNGLKER